MDINGKMNIVQTGIPGLLIIEPKVFSDDRGFFMESWNRQRYAAAGVDADFVQDNHSKSEQGVLRGLHYQIEQPQGKLVRVTRGRVYDVVVDLRQSSPTFGKWLGFWLSAENFKQLWAPPGLAHGYYSDSEIVEFCYKCTDYYAPQHERTIIWNDPDLGIDWPLPEGRRPIVSKKDSQGCAFKDAELYP
jgi:dTDP-4-dehydrorhamnose 3,5-epimerase